jgi:hypothetical protein
MLEIVGDVTASTKLNTPAAEKKVQDINDTADGDITDNAWQDSATTTSRRDPLPDHRHAPR